MRAELREFIEHVVVTPEIHYRLKSAIIGEIMTYLTSNPKFMVDHFHDMPWNGSGTLIKVGCNFLPHLYGKVGDFLHEYSGDTTEPFGNGWGGYHTNIEEVLYFGNYAHGNVYIAYFIELMKNEHGLSNDEMDEVVSELENRLKLHTFELNEEIDEMPMSDLLEVYNVKPLVLTEDNRRIHDQICEMIHRCHEPSEVFLIAREDTECGFIEHIFTSDLGKLRRDAEPCGNPNSDYLIWEHVINGVLRSQYQSAIITVKTAVSNGGTEIRSVRVEDGTVKPMEGEELRGYYCSHSRTYKRPPDEYIFCDFGGTSEN
jgi:hypothetical protein